MIKIVLTVVNRGEEAVSISSIGLVEVGDGGRCRSHHRRDRPANTRDFERDDAKYPDRLPESANEPLPLRVEGHGVLRWTYGPHQLEEFRDGTQVRGYVRFYKSFSVGPWSPGLTDKTKYARRPETFSIASPQRSTA